jgi:hypothetical protein
MEEKWSYYHDGGPSKEMVIMESHSDEKYHINITLSDPTDYERLKVILRISFDQWTSIPNKFPKGV